MFHPTIDISMGTNCGPLLADLFLHANEPTIFQGLLKKKDSRKFAQIFDSSFHDYLHHIYPGLLLALDLHHEIGNGGR